MGSLVLLTTPHEICPVDWDGTGHPCDTASQPLAQLLYNLFRRRGLPVIWIRGDTSRDIVDLNRVAAHDTPFARKFRGQLGEARVFLDVHSFPDEHDPWTGYDLVFLSQIWPPPPWVVDMVIYLRERGFRAKVVAGAKNYLVDVGSIKGVPSILVEMNEQRNIKQAAEALADFIQLYFFP
jgi:hypothetical protein